MTDIVYRRVVTVLRVGVASLSRLVADKIMVGQSEIFLFSHVLPHVGDVIFETFYSRWLIFRFATISTAFGIIFKLPFSFRLYVYIMHFDYTA